MVQTKTMKLAKHQKRTRIEEREMKHNEKKTAYLRLDFMF